MIKYFLLLFITLAFHSEAVTQTSITLSSVYHDYYLGLKEAKKVSKPILLWFTGNGCKENRDNQVMIIGNKEIVDKLNAEFITIILYVDDRTRLSEVQIMQRDGKQIKVRTHGGKWAHLQMTKYQSNRQPFITVIDSAENRLLDLEPEEFSEKKFKMLLDRGLEIFRLQ